MADAAALARDYLDVGLARLQEQAAAWDEREQYHRGEQRLPYAPPGVSDEYLELREQSLANFLGLAMAAPVQRMRAEGLRDGTGQMDNDTWTNVWQPNKLDDRQAIVYTQMLVHGRGIWSVSRNPKRTDRPKVRVESSRRVWIEPNPEDPFESLFAVKTFTVDDARSRSQLWTPGGQSGALHVAYVYTDTSWFRFEQRGSVAAGGAGWEPKGSGDHGLGEVPFVPSDANVDADGVPHSAIAPLIPQQDALNTIRFNTLLAMQFSAYRQRGVSGYDPVVRDAAGNPVPKRDKNGEIVLDDNGQPVPAIRQMGRIGVDRLLVFPGSDTKMWDIPESNLANYISVYSDFLTTFFSTGQVPPQYMLSRMSNLSGDALAGAESTLQALVRDLKDAAGEAIETVNRLANRARGLQAEDYSAEVVWADAEARSFSQTIDAITKLISVGFPRRSAFEMIPGATPPKVEGWMEQAREEALDPMLEQFTRELDAPAATGGVWTPTR
ncbi:phage portal protein [Tomitella gaofuii]|uniref:phage portal protein n=1 Tax=Tomitella gaofuii TaxID=2760083 RepID=UPI0015F9634B|nr:phage portal protein [Tomitella gaofuii]